MSAIKAYNLTIDVMDDAGLSSPFWLYVQLTNVNDETPIFTQNIYSFTVDENVAIGTQVDTVTAIDADVGTSGIMIERFFISYLVVFLKLLLKFTLI